MKEYQELDNAARIFKDLVLNTQRKNDLKFNVITQDMFAAEQAQLFGKKRLGRQKTEVLEDWHQSHFEKPYLNEATLCYLMDKTELSKGQIRNW